MRVADRRGIISREVGLTVWTGELLAAWLREQGLPAEHHAGIGWATLASFAGTYPLALGGRGWNHWAGVRGLDAAGNVRLAYSALSWKAVGQVPDRDEFDRLGPWAIVMLRLEEDPAVIAELQAKLRDAEGINRTLGHQVADKDRRLMRVVEGLAIVADDLVPAMARKGTSL